MSTLHGPIGGILGGQAATLSPSSWAAITASDLAPNGTLQPAGYFLYVEVYHAGVDGVLHVLTRAQAGSDDQDGAWLLAPGEGKRFGLHGLQEASISLRATAADVDYRIEAGTFDGLVT